MEDSNPLYFKSRLEWRKWLRENHHKKKGVWIIYYKKHTDKPSVSYEDAVEEAICFGWIDSKVNSIDTERFMQKYTPRNPKSVWSLLNKKRAEKMIEKGKMTTYGLKPIEEGKKSGAWHVAYTLKKKFRIPKDLKESLMKNKKAWTNFNAFANTYRNMYIGWVTGSGKEETRKKRIEQVAKLSEQNKKSWAS
jgi:uncharacterized protein YdeI (YjbR/CyaY-like superfamily)